MWIIIRLLIGIAVLFAAEFYFINRLNFATKRFFPKFYERKFRLVRRIFLVWINLYPLFLIFLFTYFGITGSYLTSPESWITDYLLIYPFWISFILMIQCFLFIIPLHLLKLLSSAIFKKREENFVKIFSVLTFIIIGFFILYIPTRVIYDYNTVDIREVEL